MDDLTLRCREKEVLFKTLLSLALVSFGARQRNVVLLAGV
jgi:hypothetical protein